jgi:pyridoxine 4-dehydrogenase
MIDGLADAFDAGLCRTVGVSNYGPRALRRVHSRLARRGIRLASCQVQHSLLKRTSERSGLLEVAAELGVTLIAYSPLALGLLSSPSKQRPGLRGFLFGVQSSRDPELVRLAATVDDIARQRGVPPSTVAINWTRTRGLLPIVGVRNTAQASDLLACTKYCLSDGEAAELDKASSRCKEVTDNVFMTE